MENRTLFDFDVDITQVLLAHYHSIPPSGHITTYHNGRPFHGIICILSGSAQYHFTGRTPILLKQGDIAFIPASTSYEVYCTDNQPLDHYTINFLPKKIPSLIGCLPMICASFIAQIISFTQSSFRKLLHSGTNVK